MSTLVRHLWTSLFVASLMSATQAHDCSEQNGRCMIICVYELRDSIFYDGKWQYSHNDCTNPIATSKCAWCNADGGCDTERMCNWTIWTPNCWYKRSRCLCTEEQCTP